MDRDFSNFLNTAPEFLATSAKIAVKIFVILIIVFILQKFIQHIIESITDKDKTSSTFIEFLRSTLRWSIYVIASIVILQLLGFKISSLWTIITAAATLIAIGFVAVWSVLSNLLCTLMLLISRPFQIGDQIEIIDPAMTSGIGGQVRNINLLFTTLTEVKMDNREVWKTHIPNNLFFQKIVKCKAADQSFSLDDQLFSKESLLKKDVHSKSD